MFGCPAGDKRWVSGPCSVIKKPPVLTETSKLFPLAIAEEPTAKFLYDSDFMIMESVEFPVTNLEYSHRADYDGGYLSFYSSNNNTDSFSEEMNIKKGFEKQTTNFTIEVYSNYPKDYEPFYDHFCKDNSSEALRGIIHFCNARMRLREMTLEEQEQMRKFKEEQKSKSFIEEISSCKIVRVRKRFSNDRFCFLVFLLVFTRNAHPW